MVSITIQTLIVTEIEVTLLAHAHRSLLRCWFSVVHDLGLAVSVNM
jgi:hypothetical protein